MILLIEDNVPFGEMLAAMLGHAGHQVLQAGNGKQAMDHLRSVPVDLVITDIVMPDRDGIETIMQLRKTNPGLPVIAMSGDARPMRRCIFRLPTGRARRKRCSAVFIRSAVGGDQRGDG